jgi:hypothetical protein
MYIPTRKVLGWVRDFEGALNVTTVMQHVQHRHRNSVQYVSTGGNSGRTKARSHGRLEREYNLMRFVTWQHHKK